MNEHPPTSTPAVGAGFPCPASVQYTLQPIHCPEFGLSPDGLGAETAPLPIDPIMMNPLSEPQIIAAEERLRQAMLHSDLAELDALIAPTLIFTTHWGQRMSKADDLALHRSGSLNLSKLTPTNREIQLHENFAVVSVQMQLRGEYEGQPVDETLRYTRVWAMSSTGGLQVVAGHAAGVVP